MIHILFEQSGTFKKAFQSMGRDAITYDIENTFEKTDHVIDLLKQIENYHTKKASIFDNIKATDLVFAFYPCTYFSGQNELIFSGKAIHFRTWGKEQATRYIKDRLENRALFLKRLKQLVAIAKDKGFGLIVENPYHNNYLLKQKEFSKPDLVIMDRRKLGDWYKKPTMFYYYNLKPTYIANYTLLKKKRHRRVLKERGINRSLIHPDFAHNFINKYIFGI